jgi:hypothetical protein
MVLWRALKCYIRGEIGVGDLVDCTFSFCTHLFDLHCYLLFPYQDTKGFDNINKVTVI